MPSQEGINQLQSRCLRRCRTWIKHTLKQNQNKKYLKLWCEVAGFRINCWKGWVEVGELRLYEHWKVFSFWNVVSFSAKVHFVKAIFLHISRHCNSAFSHFDCKVLDVWMDDIAHQLAIWSYDKTAYLKKQISLLTTFSSLWNVYMNLILIN